jgi:HEAT repeat protein
MGLSKVVLAAVLFAHLGAIDREHVAYLMQSKEIDSAIELYEEYKTSLGRHDFEILQRMAMIILEQGVRSADHEVQLLSLFGAAIAGLESSIDILEQGVRSTNGETQMASIQFLARMQDDRCDELLTKAMASPFLMARMEAGFHLASRKHRKATGHIEALMYRIPHEFWFYFPQFFALIGTADAIGILRQLMEDTNPMVRVEAILCAARYGRDDLLTKIRAHATHLHPDEQEAAACALGILKDSKSIPQLQKLSTSPSTNVQLAALRSLYILGEASVLEKVIGIAKTGNLFAIELLGDMPGSEEFLTSLLENDTINIRMNAAMALLKRRDPRALPVIEEILLRDTRDLGFQPHASVGHSLTAWKVVPSLELHQKALPYDLYGVSLNLREQLLIQCIELPQNRFLHVAHRIFDTRQYDLVPLLVALLENHQTDETIKLLKQKAHQAGSPQIRAYCNLSLFRLNQPGPYEKAVRDWIFQAKATEMIRFRPSIPFNMRNADSPYELTPEESSRLLIEAYQTLSDRHDTQAIDMLLGAIKEGNPKNRYALAGLLIRAIQ